MEFEQPGLTSWISCAKGGFATDALEGMGGHKGRNRLRIGEIDETGRAGAAGKLAAAFQQRHGVTPRRWQR